MDDFFTGQSTDSVRVPGRLFPARVQLSEISPFSHLVGTVFRQNSSLWDLDRRKAPAAIAADNPNQSANGLRITLPLLSQRFAKIVDQVLRVLDPDRQTQQPFGNAGVGFDRVAMFNQALHASQ